MQSKITGKLIILSLLSLITAYVLTLVLRGDLAIPAVLEIGPLNIHLYGLILFAGILASAFWAKHLAMLQGWGKHVDLVEILLYLMIPGIIGARIYHVVTDFQLYADNLANVFAIWNGGLGLIGALIGGAIGLYVYARNKKMSFEKMLAVIVVAVPIGQAIGRLGNLVNQEIFGPPTNLPWGVYISPTNRPVGYEQSDYFQPLFLYEMIGNLVLAVVLYIMWKKGVDGKNLIFTYIAGYGAIRYFLDFFRLEGGSGFSIGGLFLTYTQWLMWGILIFVMVFGSCYQLWYKHKYGKWFTEFNFKSKK